MEFFNRRQQGSGDGDDAPEFVMRCSVCENPINRAGRCVCTAVATDEDETVTRLLANFLNTLLLKLDTMALPDLTPATPSVRLQRSASALLSLYHSHSSADAPGAGGGPILDVRYAENGVSIDVEDDDLGNHVGDEAEEAVDAGDDGDEQELPLTAVRITFPTRSGIASSSSRRRRSRMKVELMGGTLCWAWLSGIIVPLRRRIRWCIYESSNGASGSESTEEEEKETEPEFKHEEEKEDELCCVCKEALCQDGEGETETEMLPCRHVFHWECLRRWIFEYKSECPLCRTQFTV